jgi:hypothetical protein
VLLLQQRDEQPGSRPHWNVFRSGTLQFTLNAVFSQSTMTAYRERVAVEVLAPLALRRVGDVGPIVAGDNEILILAK